MSRLLIDTNIIIDLLSKRKEFYNEAAKLFSIADKNFLILSVSSLTFANTNYTNLIIKCCINKLNYFLFELGKKYKHSHSYGSIF